MANLPHFIQRLGLTGDADERAIRRAYARELKLIDQEEDPAGFQSLRESYDAALSWARFREQAAKTFSPGPNAETTEIATANDFAGHDEIFADQFVPAPAEVESGSDSAPRHQPLLTFHDAGINVNAGESRHANQQEEEDPEIQASEVFAEFLQRYKTAIIEHNLADDAPIQRELRRSLSDVRLINIVAREIFERRIAHLLSAGWQPGHEVLFVAAINVFNWTADRKRVFSLGHVASALDAAIDQRNTFYLQSEKVQEPQRWLIARLRNPNPPNTSELIKYMPALEALARRFPAWLSIITNVQSIGHWRELDRSVPRWRRKLIFKAKPVPSQSDGQQRRRGINWVWIIFMMLSIAGRTLLSDHESGKPTSSRWPERIESRQSGSQTSSRQKAVSKDVIDLVNRGTSLMNSGDVDGAIASFSKAIALDPDCAMAYANRAMVYLWKDETSHASNDLDKAASLDASNAVVYRGRGMLAYKAQQYPKAIAAFTKSLGLEPRNLFALFWRAQAYEHDEKRVEALADADEIIRLQPAFVDAYLIRAHIFFAQGNKEQAESQANAAVAANPKSVAAYKAAAAIRKFVGDEKEAMSFLDRGLAATHDASIALFRANFRPPSDIDGRRGDIKMALALDPHSVDALRMRAELEFTTQEYAAAARTYTQMLSEAAKAGPERARLLTDRGVVYAKMNRLSLAKADFLAARKAASSSSALNHICWELAVQNVALQSALAACNDALAKDPESAPALDSKGFVLVRLGRYKDAVASYDAALERRPGIAASFLGRGIAKRRLGDILGSTPDLQAARAIDPAIVKQFAAIGMVP